MMAKACLVLLFSLVLLLSFEAVSYLLIPDSKSDTLESILRILEEDPVLFWKQRPYLNTAFQGVNIKTNSLGLRNKKLIREKKENTYRIICLGASPTFGWGVEYSNTYPLLLEQILNKSQLPQDMKIEVINAGQIGYSSYQGLILLKEYLLRYSPDLITVSYVLNDIDRYKFYRNEGLSDKDLSVAASLKIKFNNFFNRSRACVLLKRIISFLVSKNGKIYSGMLRNRFNLASTRVLKDQYRANLEEIAKICKSNKIKLVFIKMPINLSLPHLSEYENSIIKERGNLGKFYYELGQDCVNRKEYQKGAAFFEKAKNYQVLECYDDGKVYHAIMEEVADKNNIPLVDAVNIFLKEGNGRELFNGPKDPIHPNAFGHKLIAEGVFEEISKKDLLGNHN